MTRYGPDLRGLDLVPIPTYRGTPATPASDLTGLDLSGRTIDLAVTGVDRWTLLLFLSARCDGCREFWQALSDPAGGWPEVDELQVAVVTRGPAVEDVAELGRLTAGTVPLVMSDEAHRAYRVHGPPFFVLVEGRRARVATEGVAFGPTQVVADMERARRDPLGPASPGTDGPVERG